ncbi:hypothetical protein C7446_2656 [Kushneria sinocarnis]|uniref:FimV N-terminal domain-containing protein n=1 Tax=Kushneria sinocarnis TaxID=595502 RepID=A0A420WUX5_9GAMM|nr:hypothetical protein [Kushneria sinocarnis]RKQ97233.1 hypothetical protein C7446_2656 [Kushneria sinocarnis]
MRQSRTLAMVLGLVAGTLAADAQALGIGPPVMHSWLGEPLQARLPLLDTASLDASAIHVQLADETAFDRAGLSRSAATDTLRFDVSGAPGSLYVTLQGRRPLTSPWLELVLAVTWPGGELTPVVTLLPAPPGSADAVAPAGEPVDRSAREMASGPLPAVAAQATGAADDRQALQAGERRATSGAEDEAAASHDSSAGSAEAQQLASLAERLTRFSARLEALEQQSAGQAEPAASGPPPWRPAFEGLRREQHQLAERLETLEAQREAASRARSGPPVSLPSSDNEPSPASHDDGWLIWLVPAAGLLLLATLMLVWRQRAWSQRDREASSRPSPAGTRAAREEEAVASQPYPTPEAATLPAASAAAEPRQAPIIASEEDQEAEDSGQCYRSVFEEEDAAGDEDVLEDARIFSDHGRPRQARELLEAARLRHPHHRETRLQLMAVLADLGEHEQLIEQARYFEGHPDPAVTRRVSQLLASREQAMTDRGGRHAVSSNEPAVAAGGVSATGPDEPRPGPREAADELVILPLGHPGGDTAGAETPSTDAAPALAGGETRDGVGHAGETRERSSAQEALAFPAEWTLEEVAFDAHERDNDASDIHADHDALLMRAHLLLEAGDHSVATPLLERLLAEGSEETRTATRTLMARFDLHESS